MKKFTLKAAMLGATAMVAAPASADQVIADDLIVQGSACIGIDCSNGEAFGFDTLRLKENNLRIKAQDTSASASFPTVDWQITFNDSANGGANKFSVDDIDNNRTPFTIEAGSINNALYVDSSGDIGVGTSTPVVELHAVDGNSPTLRLEQDGSSGFTPQTWDLAGNETNFFLRDVTNGSKLPFRVQPNTPDQSLFLRTTSMTINEGGQNYDLRVESDTLTNALFLDGETGRLGLGTSTPEQSVHINGGNLLIEQAGPANMTFRDTTDAGPDMRIQHVVGETRFSYVGTGAVEMALSDAGNLTVSGNFISGATTLNVPDYVFADDYELMPLAEVEAFIDDNSHLPQIPSAAEINKNGLNHSTMQMALLKKVEELTLYTLAQEKQLSALKTRVEELSAN